MIKLSDAEQKSSKDSSSIRNVIYINKSNKHISIYIKDNKQTIFGISSKCKDSSRFKKEQLLEYLTNKTIDFAQKKNYKKFIFARGRYKYTGRIKKIIDKLRSKGLVI